jgi:DNA (cytosine-5)-methyltransferase 1
MRFIDLFAGLGGFHLALRDLGHTCVFASEVDETLRTLYEKNFGMSCAGDIRDIDPSKIPYHDILCAGFPCQPFSKAGSQQGLRDTELGELYLDILRVIQYCRPRYLVLENVPNLAYQRNGKTWQTVARLLEGEGYNVAIETISPEQYGIPQIRTRIYIVGSLDPLDGFSSRLRRGRKHKLVPLKSFLEVSPLDARPIPPLVKERLEVWQQFLDLIPKNESIPHPLWAMEFGATYPFERTTPSAMTTDAIRRYRGSFGCSLSQARGRQHVFRFLPSHAIRNQKQFPKWKIRFVRKNRAFFKKHAAILGGWIRKVQKCPPSFQKFEWNCREPNPSDEDRHLSKYVIQVRPSGVRVKRQTTIPSLVAMTPTQVPIIMWEGRYMTPTEGKLLQSMERIRYLPDSATKAYEALGNAVNVRVARRVAMALIGHATATPVKEQETLWPPLESIPLA